MTDAVSLVRNKKNEEEKKTIWKEIVDHDLAMAERLHHQKKDHRPSRILDGRRRSFRMTLIACSRLIVNP